MGATLEAHLKSFALGGGSERREVATLIRHLADAALRLRDGLAHGGLSTAAYPSRSTSNADGDLQHDLDILSDELFLDAARSAGVGGYASEERDSAMPLNAAASIALAIDPLDGSSNIDSNLSIGTIFSVLPFAGDLDAAFRQGGQKQLAAGFFIYGPQLRLALTLGQGTHIFGFSQRMGTFVEHRTAVVMPEDTGIFSINASNYRHWDEAVRLYVDDCLKGADGVRGRDFNMRWNASLVAEAFRILVKGGVFLYPRDGRKGYASGRLRLLYEANPIAMLVEQAGGAAIDGNDAILDAELVHLHQRVPLIFGSKSEVEAIGRYHSAPSSIGARHPLFGHRGLFRA